MQSRPHFRCAFATLLKATVRPRCLGRAAGSHRRGARRPATLPQPPSPTWGARHFDLARVLRRAEPFRAPVADLADLRALPRFGACVAELEAFEPRPVDPERVRLALERRAAVRVVAERRPRSVSGLSISFSDRPCWAPLRDGALR